jgi:beta-N-acetylhexosaminidase
LLGSGKLLRTHLICLLAAVLWLSSTLIPAHAQEDPVAARLAQMTTAEKVGQLFLVAFWGHNPSASSRAGLLIQQYKIGGVVLLSSNLNLVNQGTDTPGQLAQLSSTLQQMALDEAGSGIPLFIAIDHEGDGYPYTRITNGTAPLPNPMAIGATWDPRYAEQVGEIVGSELSAMGINMLLGPVVDVLDDPRPSGRGDIGTRAFGGDPYWVGEMGRAYIRGVHAGSQGKVLTVAKHFPGHGGSDRLPDDEVATVDKSLQELRRVELAPFFAVTNPRDPEELDRADALMSSHIRYRGFYGDIREFTRPMSFDAEGMQALFDLPELHAWREEGLIVSDSLGVRAVRQYFDPQLQTFPHRQIAREAFLAGNDLLLLAEFALAFSWDAQYNNVVDTIEYFQETYDHDPAFAARVDQAVTRILRAKLQLYPNLAPEEVSSAADALSRVGLPQYTTLVEAISRRAATVLQPTVDSMPRAPRGDEDILIFAEERLIRECFDDVPECDPHPLVPPRAVEEAILRFYGPDGTGLIDPAHIQTRTYGQLKTYLAQQQGDVGDLLQKADWIVFAMLDPNPRYLDSDALQLFLAQNAQQIYNARVVVLAYTAPYYLDSTEISKLTGYYVFYSKTQPFIDTSVRVLFDEIRPEGHSPVSIEGTSYDLKTQLAPDPAQKIDLTRLEPEGAAAAAPLSLYVRTSLIRDRNGNPVPDDTPASFIARDAVTGQILDTATALTIGGMAEARLSILRPARVLVAAYSGDAASGSPLTFEALAEPTPTSASLTPAPVQGATTTPSPTPTRTDLASSTPLPSTPTVTTTPRPAAPGSGTPAPPLAGWQGEVVDLPIVLGSVLAATAIGYVWRRRESVLLLVRVLLAAWCGALLGYLAYGWAWLPFGAWIKLPSWATCGTTSLAGALLLVTLAATMRQRTDRR